MKKILATAAALSLMLIACGDDSSANAGGPGGIIQRTVVSHSGKCTSPYDYALKKEQVSEELPKAYLNHGEGGYEILIQDKIETCGMMGNWMAEREGDTLRIWLAVDSTMAMTDCICKMDRWFDISADDADVKYFEYSGDVYQVVLGPAPAKQSSSSVAESSSSDTESSSSFALPVESSSSVVIAGDLHHIITDANGQCGANSRSSDPLVDANVDYPSLDTVRVREAAIPPVAYRYVGTERTGFTIENLSITCGLVVDTLDVNVSGDTVYVNATFDRTNAQRCICNFKIEFAVENDPAYSHATVLVFDENPDYEGNEPDILPIVDMDVVSIEEVAGTKQAKDINLMCKNDRQTANAPVMASDALLPGKIDTTEKVTVAGRVVGDDGFDTIIIPEVMMPCEIVFEKFDVHASNGTLYVEPKVDPDSPITNCICPTRVTFKIEQNEAFSNTNYLVFDGGEPMPLKNGVVVDASVLDN